MRRVLMVLLLLVSAGQFVHADDATPKEEDLIRAAISSYKTAFDKGDAKAVAGHWTPEGEFTPPGGETIKGQAELEKSFTQYFQDSPGAKIELESVDIRLISPGVAVENGVAEVILPEQEPSITEYSAVHVKTPAGWKLDNVTENSVVVPQTHYEHLKSLEWMIGTWVDEGADGSVETVCKWTKNKNFMTRSFKVHIQDRIALEGTQVIGWDPIKKTIRSWLFDSEGGFGVGIWTQNENRWTVRTLQVLANGEKASGVNVMTKIDENTFTFRSLGREVDGELLPGVDEITIVRK
ncbi:SnoaL-like domain protein [Gimesia panareensis]|uniref:SnoaL-like domain protein n=1 Tax=Gimesia panareensis TaxID=2527978 RepID=A0A517Q8D1_9PLAN|nr:SgcJ/EcaC family oxidoreductase [Gimesia panareensis]QDT27889.1 SnoaL-like domain protein [Gimesia panareensis]